MWTNRYWQAELWSLVFIILVVGLIGSLFGKAAVAIGFVIFLYLGWNLIQLSRLYQWKTNPEKHETPSAPGIWGEIFDALYKQQRKHRAELKQQRNIISEFRASTAALKDGVMLISKKGEIRWFNRSAAKLLGLNRITDVGQRLFNLLRHPNFIDYENARDYQKALTIPAPVDESMMISIHITPYNDDQKLVIIRDITEKHQLERVRQDFIANVSHELRTPLTVISGYLEMLDPDMNPDLKSIANPLKLMHQQALNMGHLVDDLLFLSKLDSKREIKSEQSKGSLVDINLLLDGICAEANALSGDSQHKILFHSHTSARLKGSEKQLRSAFSNLVFNAVRYTPAQGAINIYWQETDKELIVKVTDNGNGIASEHIPRLTERFYRVDSGRHRSQGGTGLGLAIVKHVLELHNAHLKIESTLGKGSSFSCVFPKK